MASAVNCASLLVSQNQEDTPLAAHGWVYSLFDGRVRELGMDVAAQDELQPAYQRALASVPPKGKRDE